MPSFVLCLSALRPTKRLLPFLDDLYVVSEPIGLVRFTALSRNQCGPMLGSESMEAKFMCRILQV